MFTFGIPVTQTKKIIQHFEASSNLVKIHNNYNDDNDNNIVTLATKEETSRGVAMRVF